MLTLTRCTFVARQKNYFVARPPRKMKFQKQVGGWFICLLATLPASLAFVLRDSSRPVLVGKVGCKTVSLAALTAVDKVAFQRALLADRFGREAAVKNKAREIHSGTAAAATATNDDLLNLLMTRRTINDFEETLPIGWDKALERAIQAAIHAPNHKKTEPWRFHLLGPESIRRVCELNANIVSSSKGPLAGQKKLERWLKMPGWLVVTCKRGMDGESLQSMDDPTSEARENYAAVCCAVQNLCLSLHNDGIGTKWTTGPVNFDEGFSDAAGLSLDEYVVGTMWFGTAANTPNPPSKKLAIEDVLIRHD